MGHKDDETNTIRENKCPCPIQNQNNTDYDHDILHLNHTDHVKYIHNVLVCSTDQQCQPNIYCDKKNICQFICHELVMPDCEHYGFCPNQLCVEIFEDSTRSCNDDNECPVNTVCSLFQKCVSVRELEPPFQMPSYLPKYSSQVRVFIQIPKTEYKDGEDQDIDLSFSQKIIHNIKVCEKEDSCRPNSYCTEENRCKFSCQKFDCLEANICTKKICREIFPFNSILCTSNSDCPNLTICSLFKRCVSVSDLHPPILVSSLVDDDQMLVKLFLQMPRQNITSDDLLDNKGNSNSIPQYDFVLNKYHNVVHNILMCNEDSECQPNIYCRNATNCEYTCQYINKKCEHGLDCSRTKRICTEVLSLDSDLCRLDSDCPLFSECSLFKKCVSTASLNPPTFISSSFSDQGISLYIFIQTSKLDTDLQLIKEPNEDSLTIVHNIMVCDDREKCKPNPYCQNNANCDFQCHESKTYADLETLCYSKVCAEIFPVGLQDCRFDSDCPTMSVCSAFNKCVSTSYLKAPHFISSSSQHSNVTILTYIQTPKAREVTNIPSQNVEPMVRNIMECNEGMECRPNVYCNKSTNCSFECHNLEEECKGQSVCRNQVCMEMFPLGGDGCNLDSECPVQTQCSHFRKCVSTENLNLPILISSSDLDLGETFPIYLQTSKSNELNKITTQPSISDSGITIHNMIECQRETLCVPNVYCRNNINCKFECTFTENKCTVNDSCTFKVCTEQFTYLPECSTNFDCTNSTICSLFQKCLSISNFNPPIQLSSSMFGMNPKTYVYLQTPRSTKSQPSVIPDYDFPNPQDPQIDSENFIQNIMECKEEKDCKPNIYCIDNVKCKFECNNLTNQCLGLNECPVKVCTEIFLDIPQCATNLDCPNWTTCSLYQQCVMISNLNPPIRIASINPNSQVYLQTSRPKQEDLTSLPTTAPLQPETFIHNIIECNQSTVCEPNPYCVDNILCKFECNETSKQCLDKGSCPVQVCKEIFPLFPTFCNTDLECPNMTVCSPYKKCASLYYRNPPLFISSSISEKNQRIDVYLQTANNKPSHNANPGEGNNDPKDIETFIHNIMECSEIECEPNKYCIDNIHCTFECNSTSNQCFQSAFCPTKICTEKFLQLPQLCKSDFECPDNAVCSLYKKCTSIKDLNPPIQISSSFSETNQRTNVFLQTGKTKQDIQASPNDSQDSTRAPDNSDVIIRNIMECNVNTECKANQYCVDNINCKFECNKTSNQCFDSQICVAKICSETFPLLPQLCRTDVDCQNMTVCAPFKKCVIISTLNPPTKISTSLPETNSKLIIYLQTLKPLYENTSSAATTVTTILSETLVQNVMECNKEIECRPNTYCESDSRCKFECKETQHQCSNDSVCPLKGCTETFPLLPELCKTDLDCPNLTICSLYKKCVLISFLNPPTLISLPGMDPNMQVYLQTPKEEKDKLSSTVPASTIIDMSTTAPQKQDIFVHNIMECNIEDQCKQNDYCLNNQNCQFECNSTTKECFENTSCIIKVCTEIFPLLPNLCITDLDCPNFTVCSQYKKCVLISHLNPPTPISLPGIDPSIQVYIQTPKEKLEQQTFTTSTSNIISLSTTSTQKPETMVHNIMECYKEVQCIQNDYCINNQNCTFECNSTSKQCPDNASCVIKICTEIFPLIPNLCNADLDCPNLTVCSQFKQCVLISHLNPPSPISIPGINPSIQVYLQIPKEKTEQQTSTTLSNIISLSTTSTQKPETMVHNIMECYKEIQCKQNDYCLNNQNCQFECNSTSNQCFGNASCVTRICTEKFPLLPNLCDTDEDCLNLTVCSLYKQCVLISHLNPPTPLFLPDIDPNIKHYLQTPKTQIEDFSSNDHNEVTISPEESEVIVHNILECDEESECTPNEYCLDPSICKFECNNTSNQCPDKTLCPTKTCIEIFPLLPNLCNDDLDCTNMTVCALYQKCVSVSNLNPPMHISTSVPGTNPKILVYLQTPRALKENTSPYPSYTTFSTIIPLQSESVVHNIMECNDDIECVPNAYCIDNKDCKFQCNKTTDPCPVNTQCPTKVCIEIFRSSPELCKMDSDCPVTTICSLFKKCVSITHLNPPIKISSSLPDTINKTVIVFLQTPKPITTVNYSTSTPLNEDLVTTTILPTDISYPSEFTPMVNVQFCTHPARCQPNSYCQDPTICAYHCHSVNDKCENNDCVREICIEKFFWETTSICNNDTDCPDLSTCSMYKKCTFTSYLNPPAPASSLIKNPFPTFYVFFQTSNPNTSVNSILQNKTFSTPSFVPISKSSIVNIQLCEENIHCKVNRYCDPIRECVYFCQNVSQNCTVPKCVKEACFEIFPNNVSYECLSDKDCLDFEICSLYQKCTSTFFLTPPAPDLEFISDGSTMLSVFVQNAIPDPSDNGPGNDYMILNPFLTTVTPKIIIDPMITLTTTVETTSTVLTSRVVDTSDQITPITLNASTQTTVDSTEVQQSVIFDLTREPTTISLPVSSLSPITQFSTFSTESTGSSLIINDPETISTTEIQLSTFIDILTETSMITESSILPSTATVLFSTFSTESTTKKQQSTVINLSTESTSISITESSFTPMTTIALLSTLSTESTDSSLNISDPESIHTTEIQQSTTIDLTTEPSTTIALLSTISTKSTGSSLNISDPEPIHTTEIQQSTITDFTREPTTTSLTESSFLPSTTIAFLSTFSTESTVSSMNTIDPGSNFSTPSQEETTQEGTSTSLLSTFSISTSSTIVTSIAMETSVESTVYNTTLPPSQVTSPFSTSLTSVASQPIDSSSTTVILMTMPTTLNLVPSSVTPSTTLEVTGLPTSSEVGSSLSTVIALSSETAPSTETNALEMTTSLSEVISTIDTLTTTSPPDKNFANETSPPSITNSVSILTSALTTTPTTLTTLETIPPDLGSNEIGNSSGGYILSGGRNELMSNERSVELIGK